MTSKTTIVHTILLLFVFANLNIQAQNTRVSSFPDRASSPYQQKADRMKRMDAFSDHTFSPFFSIDGQIGLIGTFSKDLTRSITPPIAIGVSYRINPRFSVGIQGSMSRYGAEINYFDRSYTTAVQTTNRMIQVRINGHIPIGLRGEIYGGLGIGIRDAEVAAQEAPLEKNGAESIVLPQDGFLTTAHIGGRYSLSPRIGITGEVGSGLSLMNVGISYRLR
ncbi:MAG: hypothetical protein AAF741_13220 [Bacteroidota bacterium]